MESQINRGRDFFSLGQQAMMAAVIRCGECDDDKEIITNYQGSGSRRSGSGIRDTLQTIVSQGQGVVPLLSQAGVPQAVQDFIGRR